MLNSRRIDGVGAYDNVRRMAMLSKLDGLPKARAMLPFVSMSHGKPSRYSWVHKRGATRFVDKAEGGEQGDSPDAHALCSGYPRRP